MNPAESAANDRENATDAPLPTPTWPITVVTAADLQAPLAEEIRSLVDARISDRPFGVQLDATPAQTYRIVCDSLIAGHVYYALASGQAATADELYALGRQIPWHHHMTADTYFAVSATGGTEQLRHTGFIATRLKDAIVDHFRERDSRRPSIDTEQPDLRLHCHITAQGHTNISIELSEGSLHRRGYRQLGGLAPLRENLAAGILWRARWPQLAQNGAALFDPMCGSGTLLIEAALRLTGLPPAMRARRLGSPGWLGHDTAARQAVLDQSAPRIEEPAGAPLLIGRDIDGEQIATARENARLAEVDHLIDFQVADAWAQPCPTPLEGHDNGLLISNLPYGHRLDAYTSTETPDWGPLIDAWQRCFNGWHWAFLLPEGMGQRWPLRYERAFPFDHGGIAIELIRGTFDSKSRREVPGPIGLANKLANAAEQARELVDPTPFANRLQKNFRHVKRQAEREGLCCFRVYDADLPDFNLAIDLYRDEQGETWADIQEYRAPHSVDPQLARGRLAVAVHQAMETLELAPNHAVVRQRRRQTGQDQYQKITQERLERVVIEGGTRLRINLTDYLDTGLFLDHRQVRDRVAELARGKRLLNLFCYTATASVRAAHQGAEQTLSVDLSNTYLDWAEDNFALNDIPTGNAHQLLRADVLDWLKQRQQGPYRPDRYDVIFCDPPTFSNSKAMSDTLDIQRDHVTVVQQCMHLLAPEGTLIFSNNLKGFKLSPSLMDEYQINDLSRKTLPMDFARTPHRRSVFEIRHRNDA